MSQPKILFIPGDKKGTGFYRMMLPANALMEQKLAEVNVSFTLNGDEMNWAQLIVMQRPANWDALEYVRAARSIGKKVIYELDDYLPGVPLDNPGVRYWDGMTGKVGVSYEIMKSCDAITTTTQRLANELAPWNRNIHILPNYLDEVMWNNIQYSEEFEKKKKDDIIRIGWEGAAGHWADLELVAKVVKKITDDYPKVRFTLFGFAPKEIFYHFANVQGKCAHCGQENQLEAYEGVDILQYAAKLANLAFDIGIAPAVNISFNECKSDLRIKEYAMLRIPIVASDISPYKKSVQQGKTGYICTTAKEWDTALRELIDNEAKRLEMGRNAKMWVKDLTIQKNIWRWVQVYQKVLSQK